MTLRNGFLLVAGLIPKKKPVSRDRAFSLPHAANRHRPLVITTVGMSPEHAARHIRSVEVSSRIPTLLKRVDSLSRIGKAGSSVAIPRCSCLSGGKNRALITP